MEATPREELERREADASVEASENGSSTDPEAAEEVVEGEVVEQPQYSKSSWLEGPGDLEETEVDVPGVQDAVKIRSLTARQQADIRDACLSMKGDTAKVNSARMGVLTFMRGVVEPKFNENEAEQVQRRFGRSFTLVVDAINEISQASEADVERARRRFRPRR
jgi:hypothetical protein